MELTPMEQLEKVLYNNTETFPIYLRNAILDMVRGDYKSSILNLINHIVYNKKSLSKADAQNLLAKYTLNS